MLNDRNTKIIYSRRIKAELINYGFRPIKSVPNKKKPGFDAWVFERNDAFDEVFDLILRGYDDGK